VAVAQLSLGEALTDDARVVGLLVLGGKAAEQGARPLHGLGSAVAELVGEREEQTGERLLVVGLDGQNIEADALRLEGLVEQPVALRLFERSRDAVAVNGFQRHAQWLLALPVPV